jgi:branched-chain amino acid transport system ATP-binding protein
MANDVTQAPARARARAGIARSHQIPQPFGSLTVFENLLVAANFCGRHQESDIASLCGQVLQQTQLLALANRRAGTLTLLERKRLELARALAMAPKLLLLDEIGGGPDRGRISGAHLDHQGHKGFRRHDHLD